MRIFRDFPPPCFRVYRGSSSSSLQVRVMNTLENPTLYREIKSGAYSVLHFFLILLERKVLVLARTASSRRF